MKKYYIGGALVIILGIFIFLFNDQGSTPATVPPATTPTTTEPSVTDNTTTTTSGTTSTTASTGQYKDGTYDGDVADATYGNLQVAAVIQGGALIQVNLLQFPNAPGHTTQVNSTALPILQQEALVAQSAKVQIVSGATQSSQAFQESLGVALTAAKA